MAVLQSIDIALFRFVNETLRNSVFDALMPVFSGGPWFLPLLIVGGIGVIWRGGARGRICALMLALALPITDGLTTRVKYAVNRPRPCRTLENVNLPMLARTPRADEENEFRRLGCSDSGSMPSGHTSNWFAATMVAWIFFRGTWRFMLGLACIVGFSRIYNGVHYPSDVLVGAIFGAGCGCALVIGFDAFWRFTARRCFPLWFNALPSLVAARVIVPAPSTVSNAAKSLSAHWLNLGYIAIALMLVWRLIYIALGRIELSEDEAYQWLWSKHLAPSYFSKPPLIAYTQWLGTHLFGDNEFGVRFFSPVCAAIGSLVALRFFAKHVSARAGFWLVAIVNVTPLLSIGSTLMTVDPLLVFFWTLAMFAGWRAVQPDGETKHWAIVGLCMGLAFLSKYTALFQWLCWATFFVLWKPARLHLRRPGPYVALLVNVICSLPVLVWNWQHDWITTAHVANNANLDERWQFSWRAPLEFLGGSAGVLHPMFFIATVWAAVAMWKRGADPLLRFFFAMGAPLFLIYALYTIHSRVLLNWIAASVIPLFCLMVIYWERRYVAGTRQIRAMVTIAMLFGAFGMAVLHETDLVKKIADVYLPPRADPLRRVRGWEQMAAIVTRERAKLLSEGKPVFVIGGHYGTTGLLSFYMPEARATVESTPLVYYRYMAKPNTQFYFWPSYLGEGGRRGENAIYIHEKDKAIPAPPDIVKQFASVTEIGRFPIHRRQRVLHHVQVFACRDLQR